MVRAFRQLVCGNSFAGWFLELPRLLLILLWNGSLEL
jgi:hypothetical protein